MCHTPNVCELVDLSLVHTPIIMVIPWRRGGGDCPRVEVSTNMLSLNINFHTKVANQGSVFICMHSLTEFMY